MGWLGRSRAPAFGPGSHFQGPLYDFMEVDKQAFDALLGKLLKTPPLPKAAIPKTARRPRSDRPQREPQPQTPKR